MKRLAKYFLQGLIFVAPIGVTLYVCVAVVLWIDEPAQDIAETVFGLTIPGLGFVLAVVGSVGVVTVIGFLSSNFVTGGILSLLDRQFDRFPLIKLLHSSLKDLVGAFVGEKKRFDKPVKVELVPGSDAGPLGFITRDSMEEWNLPGQVAVYVPMCYSFAGNVIVVPKERVTPIDVPSGDVMTFIVSGGVAGREEKAENKPETLEMMNAENGYPLDSSSHYL